MYSKNDFDSWPDIALNSVSTISKIKMQTTTGKINLVSDRAPFKCSQALFNLDETQKYPCKPLKLTIHS